MPLKTYKPTSKGRRFMTGYDFAEITRSEPEWSLVEPRRKTGGRNNNGRMQMAALAALAAAPFSYFGVHQNHGGLALALPLLTLTYGLLNMYYGLVYASIHDIVAPALRGVSMAIYFVVMYIFGASWGTLIIGKLSDNFARHAAALAGSAKVTEVFRATGLQQAMLAIPVLSVALALVLWAGSRTIGRDIERQRAKTSEAVAAN